MFYVDHLYSNLNSKFEIVPDKVKTFAIDGLFRQFGIYSKEGQKCKSEHSGNYMTFIKAANEKSL